MSQVDQVEVSFSALGARIWRHKEIFSIMVFLALIAGVLYLSFAPRVYRVEARVASFSAAELRRQNYAEGVVAEGPVLLREFVDTMNSLEFRGEFFRNNILKDLRGSERLHSKDTSDQALFDRFSNGLAVKQMGDAYAMVSFMASQNQGAEKWLNEMISAADKYRIEQRRLSHAQVLASLLENIRLKEAVIAKAHAETLRRLEYVAGLARKFSLNSDFDIYSFFLNDPNANALAKMQEQVDLLRTPGTVVAGLVKVEMPARVSEQPVGPGAFFVLLYSVVTGFILAVFAVMLRECFAGVS